MGVLEVALLLGGVAVAYFLNQANAAGHLVFFPGNLGGLSFEGINPVIQGSILIQNTSNTSFTFNSLAASVTSGDTLVGNVSNFTPITIGPNSEGQLPISVRLLLLGAANDVIDAIQNKYISKKLILDGSVNANGVQVPLKLEYSIGL